MSTFCVTRYTTSIDQLTFFYFNPYTDICTREMSIVVTSYLPPSNEICFISFVNSYILSELNSPSGKFILFIKGDVELPNNDEQTYLGYLNSILVEFMHQ